ncbi:MAG: fibronectin type III domain-containing protein, partial [Planctomycetota bacterium]
MGGLHLEDNGGTSYSTSNIPAGTTAVYMHYTSYYGGAMGMLQVDYTFNVDEAGSTVATPQDTVFGDPPPRGILSGLSLNGACRLSTLMAMLVENNPPTFDGGFAFGSTHYIKPYQPFAPTVLPVTGNGTVLDVNVNPNTSEHADVPYSIRITDFNRWIQADGSYGVTEVMQTDSAWGTIRVTGLSPSTNYTFEVTGHNYYSTSVDTTGPSASATTVETTDPIVNNAHLQNAGGTTYVILGGIKADDFAGFETWSHYDSIVEANPDSTEFKVCLDLYGSITWYDTETDTADTTNPGVQYHDVGIMADGRARVNVKITHFDTSGNNGSDTSVWYYVQPYTPEAPAVTQVEGSNSTLLVNPDPHDWEDDDVEYSIWCTTESLYVQASGALGASAAWDTNLGWGAVTVTGLSEYTEYSFIVRSRNAWYPTVTLYSDWSPAGSAYTDDITNPVVVNAHCQVGSAHTSGDGYSKSGAGTIPAGTTSLYVDYDSITEDYPDWTGFQFWGQEGSGGNNQLDAVSYLFDTTTPPPQQMSGLTLNGGYRCYPHVRHSDYSSNLGVHSNFYYYIEPYEPPAPTVQTVVGNENALDVNVNADGSEYASLEYGIYCTTLTQWVQTNGTLGGSPALQTESAWGTITVGGLTPSTLYTFYTRAYNYHDSNTFNDSSTASATTDSGDETPPVVSGAKIENAGGTEYDVMGGISAGTMTLYSNCDLITEDNPDKTKFALRIDSFIIGDWDNVTNEDDTTTPPAQMHDSYSVMPNGMTRIRTTVIHTDKAGNNGSDTSGWYYVTPFTPDAPIVSTVPGSGTTLTVDVDRHIWESGSVEHSIYCTTESLYVQSGGNLGAGEVFQTDAAWGVKTVTGLTPETQYTFQTRSRNYYENTVLSDNSSTASAWTDDVTDPVVINAHVESSSGIEFSQYGGITAGMTVASLYSHYDTITENNPDSTDFTVTWWVDGGSGMQNLTNNSNTTSPSPMKHTRSDIVLDGSSKVYTKVTHFDQASNNGSHTSIEYYVEPYEPSAPTVTQVVGNGTVLDLNVNPHGSESSTIYYSIYMVSWGWIGADNNFGGARVARTDAGWGTVRITDLTPGTEYTFYVRAYNYYSNTAFINSPTASATTFGPPPAPANFRCTGRTLNSLTWEWDDVATEEGFQVLDNTSELVVVDDVPADTLVTVELSLSANLQYIRKVRAYNSGKTLFGDNSNIVTVYTMTGQATGLGLITRDTTSLQLTCNTPPNRMADSTGTRFIFESGGSGAENSSWAQADAGSVSYLDSGLDPNTTYTYRGVWRNGDGLEDVPTNTASWCTLAAIPGMTNSSATFTTSNSNSITAVVDLNGNPDGTTIELEYCNGTATQPDGSWASLGTQTTGYTWIVGSLAPESYYWFRARAQGWDSVWTDYCDVVFWQTDEAGIEGPVFELDDGFDLTIGCNFEIRYGKFVCQGDNSDISVGGTLIGDMEGLNQGIQFDGLDSTPKITCGSFEFRNGFTVTGYNGFFNSTDAAGSSFLEDASMTLDNSIALHVAGNLEMRNVSGTQASIVVTDQADTDSFLINVAKDFTMTNTSLVQAITTKSGFGEGTDGTTYLTPMDPTDSSGDISTVRSYFAPPTGDTYVNRMDDWYESGVSEQHDGIGVSHFSRAAEGQIHFGLDDLTGEAASASSYDCVTLEIRASKGSACTFFQPMIDVDGTDYKGSNFSSSGYETVIYSWATNPAGGEWTLDNINALKAGFYGKTSDELIFGGTAFAYCMQVRVDYSTAAPRSGEDGIANNCGGGGGAYYGYGGNASIASAGNGGLGKPEHRLANWWEQPMEIGACGGNGDGGALGGKAGAALRITCGGVYTAAGTVSARGQNGEDDASGGSGGGGAGGFIHINLTCSSGTTDCFVRAGTRFDVGGGNGGLVGDDTYAGGGGGAGLIFFESAVPGSFQFEEINGWNPNDGWQPWGDDLGLFSFGGGLGGPWPNSPAPGLGGEGDAHIEDGTNEVTFVRLYDLRAVGYDTGIAVLWRSGLELDHAWYNVHRADSANGTY